jgi:hypothetical protein
MDIVSLATNISPDAFKKILIASVGTIGLVWYYVCVFDVGLRPTPSGTTPTGYREFQALSITTISISLATYVGYVIGIPLQSQAPKDKPAVVSPQGGGATATKGAAVKPGDTAAGSAESASTPPAQPKEAAASLQPGTTPTDTKKPADGNVSLLQWLSAVLYVISLVLAVCFYAKHKGATEPAITGLAKSLLGFVAGVLSVGLNAA